MRLFSCHGEVRLFDREGDQEQLQHLLHWLGRGTKFISLSARRGLCRIGARGAVCLFSP